MKNILSQMRALSLYLILLTPIKLAAAPLFSTRVTVELKSEKMTPVLDAKIAITFNHILDSKSIKYEGSADSEGKFTAEDKIVSSLMITAEKEGHYPIRKDRALTRTEVDQQEIKNFEVPFVMRRRMDPVGLYAKRVDLRIPTENSRIGFDFLIGDWIKPFGRGVQPDLFFDFSREFVGYRFTGRRLDELREFSKAAHKARNEVWSEDKFKEKQGKWRGTVVMSAVKEGEGIAKVDSDYHLYSTMRMPHHAYEIGYTTSITRREETFSPVQINGTIGYFLRTRARTDEGGKIVSANYSKIIEDITFDPRGRITFAYVFNPTPNDRNLEFDPEKNLFGKLPDAEQVLSP